MAASTNTETRAFIPKSAKTQNSNIGQEADGKRYRVTVQLKRANGETFLKQARNLPSKAAARKRRDEFFEAFNVLESDGQFVPRLIHQVEEKQEPETAADAPPVLTLELWFKECEAVHWPRRVPNTAEKYIQNMRDHVIPVLGSTPLEQLSTKMVRDFVYGLSEKEHRRTEKSAAKKLAMSSITAVKAALSSCLTIAVEEEKIRHNPATRLGIRWKGIEQGRRLADPDAEQGLQGVRLMTRAEIDDLVVRAAKTQIGPCVLFQARLGLRIAEALALMPKDFVNGVCQVREQVKRIKTGKDKKTKLHRVGLKTSGSVRDIPVPKSVQDFLDSWTGPADQPFSHTEIGTFVDPRNAQRLWSSIVEAAELKPAPTTHDLRGNFCSHLLNDCGVAATVVQALAGHANIQTTLSYYSKASQANLLDAMEKIG